MHPLYSENSGRSMEEFGRYEELYLRCARLLNKSISSNPMQEPGFMEAEQYIKGMEVEARSIKGDSRKRCQGKLQQYRSDLASTRSAWATAKERAQLGLPPVSAAATAAATASSGWAADLPSGMAGELLRDSRRVLLETEGIGEQTLDNLESQRHSLLRTNEHVTGTSGLAERARLALRQMERRAVRRKLCLYSIIAALSTAICVLLWVKIRKKFG